MAEKPLYQQYLEEIQYPDQCQKITKLEFLNADNSVAYALDGTYKKRYSGFSDSRAFLKTGTLNVSLNNGQRRIANIQLENLDGAFDYAVNKIWYGNKVRLMSGIKLRSGYEFYLPQGTFYFDNPSTDWKPNRRISSYSLVDKWSYLDGTLFGNLEGNYEIPVGTNIFTAMNALLMLSRFTHNPTKQKREMIDSVLPIFTSYYTDKTATNNGKTYPMLASPKTILVERGGSYADILLALNNIIVGWIGYDETGALCVDASQDDILDIKKPVLWDFSVKSKTFCGLTETANPQGVYNDVIVWGETLEDALVAARATNRDPTSDTNADLIGLKTYTYSSDTCYTAQQCKDLAAYLLKQKTVLQKSVTITCSQMYHLRENNLITVRRDDKPGKPLERHLIQSFSLPLSEKENMTITATSVNDFPIATIQDIDISQGVT